MVEEFLSSGQKVSLKHAAAATGVKNGANFDITSHVELFSHRRGGESEAASRLFQAIKSTV